MEAASKTTRGAHTEAPGNGEPAVGCFEVLGAAARRQGSEKTKVSSAPGAPATAAVGIPDPSVSSGKQAILGPS